jgi:sugar lactone lactonase YvrE
VESPSPPPAARATAADPKREQCYGFSGGVVRIDPATRAVTTFATGFCAISGVAFGPDGSLYVTELSTDLRRMAPGT